MKSVNYQLRVKYVDALDGMVVNAVTIPVYYMQLPEGATYSNYILLVNPANGNASTKNSSDTNTTMQVQIHTWAENGNAGKMADDIANEVYQQIYPNPQFNLDLSGDGLQMVSTTMISDNTNPITDAGNREFITRIINFEHNIYHK